MMKIALDLCGVLPQTPLLQSNHEKELDKVQLRHSTKYLTSTPQNCQGQRSLSNTHSQDGPRETYDYIECGIS